MESRLRVVKCFPGPEVSDAGASDRMPERGSSVMMRVCIKCGIVDTSGERAHGLVGDVKSCSRVGSMYLYTSTWPLFHVYGRKKELTA